MGLLHHDPMHLPDLDPGPPDYGPSCLICGEQLERDDRHVCGRCVAKIDNLEELLHQRNYEAWPVELIEYIENQ